MPSTIDEIHAYWFGQLDDHGMADPGRNALWFRATAADDARCRARFAGPVAQALRGELADWEDTDRGLIALILLLDQFTRTIFRGTPQAFAGDTRALALALHCIGHGHHQRLPVIHQVFLYLPLEHSEDLGVQEQCVELFEALAKVTGLPALADYTRYAVAHRDVIARFGRFPHRNAILGRQSSAAELDYLETHGGF